MTRTNCSRSAKDTSNNLRELVVDAVAVDKNVLPIELHGVRTRCRVDLVEMAAKLPSDVSAGHTRAHASHWARRDSQFDNIVLCLRHERLHSHRIHRLGDATESEVQPDALHKLRDELSRPLPTQRL